MFCVFDSFSTTYTTKSLRIVQSVQPALYFRGDLRELRLIDFRSQICCNTERLAGSILDGCEDLRRVQ